MWKQYNSLQKCNCSECQKEKLLLEKEKEMTWGKVPKKTYSIPNISEKRKALNSIYENVRIEVLSEAKFKCFIDGCTNVANTIEHTAGRLGFYDEQARYDNIPLIIDKRFLKACCLHHNGELENNPELSKEYQLSKIHGGKKL